MKVEKLKVKVLEPRAIILETEEELADFFNILQAARYNMSKSPGSFRELELITEISKGLNSLQ